jgi:hypothetical protein
VEDDAKTPKRDGVGDVGPAAGEGAGDEPGAVRRDRRGVLIVLAVVMLALAGFFAFAAVSQIIAITNAPGAGSDAEATATE